MNVQAAAVEGAFPWRLGERIGSGAQSRIWSAEGVGARFGGIQGAVKVLDRAHGKSMFAMDQRVGVLRHPNIIATYEMGTIPGEPGALVCDGHPIGGRHYIAMEKAGGSYADALEPRGLGWPTAGYIIMDVLAGISEMHLAGLIHRDVKPANVLWFPGDGEMEGARKLCDFSLSAPCRMEELGEWDQRELFAGTPSYMAPEQIQCDWRSFGPWTDIYGVGCLLWVLLAGRVPWSDKTKAEVLRRQINAPLPLLFFEAGPARPRAWRAEAVEAWIARCTAKDVDARFQTVGEAAMALLPLLTTPEQITERTPTGFSTHRPTKSEAEKAHKHPRIYLTSAETAAAGGPHPALGDVFHGLTLSVERVPDAVARDLIVGNVLSLTPTKRNGFTSARMEAALRAGAFLPGHLRCGENVPAARIHINATRRAGGKRWVSVPTTAKAQPWDGAWWLYDGAVPPDSTLICGCTGGGHRHGCHLPMAASALAASGWDVVLDGVPVPPTKAPR